MIAPCPAGSKVPATATAGVGLSAGRPASQTRHHGWRRYTSTARPAAPSRASPPVFTRHASLATRHSSLIVVGVDDEAVVREVQVVEREVGRHRLVAVRLAGVGGDAV